MSVFDVDPIPEGTLKINEDRDELMLSNESLRLEMFLTELHNATIAAIPKTLMMQDIIKNTKDDQESYNRCHVNTHVKSGGGGGFSNSYQKNC